MDVPNYPKAVIILFRISQKFAEQSTIAEKVKFDDLAIHLRCVVEILTPQITGPP